MHNKRKEIAASKIVGIQFRILSPDEIRNSSVAHINNLDTYINNTHITKLFLYQTQRVKQSRSSLIFMAFYVKYIVPKSMIYFA